MSAEIVTLHPERKSYEAKLIRVPASGFEFRIAGTLCGGIDVAIIERSGKSGTHNIDPGEARVLADALLRVAADVEQNCLYDNDPLLMKDGE